MKRILIANQNSLWASECKRILQADGHFVKLVYMKSSLQRVLNKDSVFDLLVIRDSLTFLTEQQPIPYPFILVGCDNVSDLKEGAVNCLPSNIIPKDLCNFVKSAINTGNPSQKFGKFIGVSTVMQNVYKKIEAAATSQATVCITGESGTGKELCAQAIHKLSSRSDKPFIPVNCAAIPESLMESELFGHIKGAFTSADMERIGMVKIAEGGTLFLDEIGELPLSMQAKLLRFLQNFNYNPVGSSVSCKANIRVICATNRDLLEQVEAGLFRADLYYRLFVISISMPPLCGRADDILDIAYDCLRYFSKKEGKSFESFEKDVQDIICMYKWHGNVRELKNIINQIVVMQDAKKVTIDMLPDFIKVDSNIRPNIDYIADIQPLHIVERKAIENALKCSNGNIARAAAMLEINPSTLYRKRDSWNSQISA